MPSLITATLLRLIVSWKTLLRSFAIAIEMRATPGVYTFERSARVFTGIFGWIVILPPRCARNVESETLTIALRTAFATASDATMTLTSRVE